MGQKVHPNGFRLGVIRSWDAVWYSDKKTFSNTLEADMRVRKIIKQALAKAGIAQILIERPAKSMSVTVHTARPGMVIGKKGEDVERLKRELSDVAQVPVQLKILEVKKPEINAQLIADGIASQLERRVMFRRAMRRGLQNAMRSGAQGVKIRVSGRLNGADIARCEWSREGRVPLHTLRADIAYGTAEAKTTNGIVGVKVWVFKGEILGKQVLSAVESSAPHPSDKRQNFKSAGRRGS